MEKNEMPYALNRAVRAAYESQCGRSLNEQILLYRASAEARAWRRKIDPKTVKEEAVSLEEVLEVVQNGV